MHKSILTYCLILLFSYSLSAQENEAAKADSKPSLDGGTIKSQFEYMTKKSGNWQGHEVIKIEWLNKFKSNVQDSIKELRTNLSESGKKISDQNSQITGLETELQKLKTELAETIQRKNSMKLLGIALKKSTYNVIMWVLILGSLAVAGICFLLFKRCNVVTVEMRQTLEEVREEFDTHRKNALVREQKLARKLQDEVIKNKNQGI